MLGRPTLNTSKSHSSLLNSIEASIKGDLNNLAADIAKDLHIHDFYSMHILDYCEASFPQQSHSPLTNRPSAGLLHPQSHRQSHRTPLEERHELL